MSPRPVIHHMALAHHRRDELYRCVLLPLGRRRLALCARCLALYPALFAALGVQIALRCSPGRLDALLVALGVVPLLVDWAAGRLRWSRGATWLRLLTGALGGLGLGRAFYVYFREPGSELFWVTAIGIVIVFAAVEIVRALRLNELP